jgi:hypothetical protein
VLMPNLFWVGLAYISWSNTASDPLDSLKLTEQKVDYLMLTQLIITSILSVLLKSILWMLLHLALINQRIPSTPTSLLSKSIFVYIRLLIRVYSTAP